MSTRLLKPQDIYNFYGCAFLHDLTKQAVAIPEIKEVHSLIREIHALYVEASKARIRAEAKFLGIELEEGFSFRVFLDSLPELLQKEMEQSSEDMMRGGNFNLMGNILRAHQLAGADLKDIDTSRFGVGGFSKPKPKDVDAEWFKGGKERGRVWDDPKWHEIAKAYLAMESAQTIDEIIQAVDHLNSLQHNSFHLLIDLQTGRMLENNGVNHQEAVNLVHEILGAKRQAEQVSNLAPKMDKFIGELVKQYKKTGRVT